MAPLSRRKRVALQDLPGRGARLLDVKHRCELDTPGCRELAHRRSCVARRARVARVGQSQMRRMFADWVGTQHPATQLLKGFRPRHARQQNPMLGKKFGRAELKMNRTRPRSAQPSVHFRKRKPSQLVFATQGDMRRDQRSLHRIQDPPQSFKLDPSLRWHEQTQLHADTRRQFRRRRSF